ncbi:MAG: hypothetical protein HW390_2173 [Candidatus Brocadiaceae bacterium]|nr:hypothetical protein [Candidatus Brocadiaceae bacterium]
MERIVLLYDDSCSLCRGCMKWIELHAIRKDVFEFVPCQSEERRRRFPEVEDATCRQSLLAMLPGKVMLSGDATLPEIIVRLRGFRWFSVLFKTPIVRGLLYVLYHWVANSRYIISHAIKPLVDE